MEKKYIYKMIGKYICSLMNLMEDVRKSGIEIRMLFVEYL